MAWKNLACRGQVWLSLLKSRCNLHFLWKCFRGIFSKLVSVLQSVSSISISVVFWEWKNAKTIIDTCKSCKIATVKKIFVCRVYISGKDLPLMGLVKKRYEVRNWRPPSHNLTATIHHARNAAAAPNWEENSVSKWYVQLSPYHLLAFARNFVRSQYIIGHNCFFCFSSSD